MTSSSSSSIHSSTKASSFVSFVGDMETARPARTSGLPLQSDLASKAATRGALLCRVEAQLFQTRLDSAQRASVLVRKGARGIPILEGGDESAFLLGRPCATNVVGQLRAPQRAGGGLLECRETGQQHSQYVGVNGGQEPPDSGVGPRF